MLIKAGDFRMGSLENEPYRNDDEKWHAVTITKPFYLGVWKFESAVAAPWADPSTPPDPKEKNAFIGRTISIKRREIDGPST